MWTKSEHAMCWEAQQIKTAVGPNTIRAAALSVNRTLTTSGWDYEFKFTLCGSKTQCAIAASSP
jgi:hypothetical protein